MRLNRPKPAGLYQETKNNSSLWRNLPTICWPDEQPRKLGEWSHHPADRMNNQETSKILTLERHWPMYLSGRKLTWNCNPIQHRTKVWGWNWNTRRRSTKNLCKTLQKNNTLHCLNSPEIVINSKQRSTKKTGQNYADNCFNNASGLLPFSNLPRGGRKLETSKDIAEPFWPVYSLQALEIFKDSTLNLSWTCLSMVTEFWTS